jgi:hypothetical protein
VTSGTVPLRTDLGEACARDGDRLEASSLGEGGDDDDDLFPRACFREAYLQKSERDSPASSSSAVPTARSSRTTTTTTRSGSSPRMLAKPVGGGGEACARDGDRLEASSLGEGGDDDDFNVGEQSPFNRQGQGTRS